MFFFFRNIFLKKFGLEESVSFLTWSTKYLNTSLNLGNTDKLYISTIQLCIIVKGTILPKARFWKNYKIVGRFWEYKK